MSSKQEPSGPELVGENERIGRYELVLELDSGPTGKRFAAYVLEGNDEGRVVAVRRVRAPEDERDALARVALAATAIRDPHVTALLNARSHGSELVVASEYVEGATLFELCGLARSKKSPIPPSVVLRIVTDLCAGLTSARDQWKSGVALAGEPLASALYGGVCPSQAVVASFGDTLLTEVGLTGAALRLPHFARSDEALGYRAPEQLGDAPKADERTDVFQLGILMWEALANKNLFAKPRVVDKTPPTPSLVAEVEKRIREEPIVGLGELSRGGAPLPDGVVALVARALERDPEKRFQRLEELMGAIDELPAAAVATSAEAVVSVERLARDLLEERRLLLERAAGVRHSLVGPESRRVTARPPGPDAEVRVTLPNIPALSSFSTSESPTARRRPTPVEPATPPVVPEEVAAALREESVEIDVSDGPSDAPSPEPSPAPARADVADLDLPRLRGGGRGRVVLYLGIVLAVAVGLWLWQSSGTSSPDSAPEPSGTAERPASPPRPAATRTATPVEPTTVPVAPTTSAPEPERGEATPKPSAKPQPTKAPVAKPPASSGNFRPKGI